MGLHTGGAFLGPAPRLEGHRQPPAVGCTGWDCLFQGAPSHLVDERVLVGAAGRLPGGSLLATRPGIARAAASACSQRLCVCCVPRRALCGAGGSCQALSALAGRCLSRDFEVLPGQCSFCPCHSVPCGGTAEAPASPGSRALLLLLLPGSLMRGQLIRGCAAAAGGLGGWGGGLCHGGACLGPVGSGCTRSRGPRQPRVCAQNNIHTHAHLQNTYTQLSVARSAFSGPTFPTGSPCSPPLPSPQGKGQLISVRRLCCRGPAGFCYIKCTPRSGHAA